MICLAGKDEPCCGGADMLLGPGRGAACQLQTFPSGICREIWSPTVASPLQVKLLLEGCGRKPIDCFITSPISCQCVFSETTICARGARRVACTVSSSINLNLVKKNIVWRVRGIFPGGALIHIPDPYSMPMFCTGMSILPPFAIIVRPGAPRGWWPSLVLARGIQSAAKPLQRAIRR